MPQEGVLHNRKYRKSTRKSEPHRIKGTYRAPDPNLLPPPGRAQERLREWLETPQS